MKYGSAPNGAPVGQPGQVFTDALENRREKVTIGPDGWGEFPVSGRSVSVWIPKA